MQDNSRSNAFLSGLINRFYRQHGQNSQNRFQIIEQETKKFLQNQKQINENNIKSLELHILSLLKDISQHQIMKQPQKIQRVPGKIRSIKSNNKINNISPSKQSSTSFKNTPTRQIKNSHYYGQQKRQDKMKQDLALLLIDDFKSDKHQQKYIHQLVHQYFQNVDKNLVNIKDLKAYVAKNIPISSEVNHGQPLSPAKSNYQKIINLRHKNFTNNIETSKKNELKKLNQETHNDIHQQKNRLIGKIVEQMIRDFGCNDAEIEEEIEKFVKSYFKKQVLEQESIRKLNKKVKKMVQLKKQEIQFSKKLENTCQPEKIQESNHKNKIDVSPKKLTISNNQINMVVDNRQNKRRQNLRIQIDSQSKQEQRLLRKDQYEDSFSEERFRSSLQKLKKAVDDQSQKIQSFITKIIKPKQKLPQSTKNYTTTLKDIITYNTHKKNAQQQLFKYGLEGLSDEFGQKTAEYQKKLKKKNQYENYQKQKQKQYETTIKEIEAWGEENIDDIARQQKQKMKNHIQKFIERQQQKFNTDLLQKSKEQATSQNGYYSPLAIKARQMRDQMIENFKVEPRNPYTTKLLEQKSKKVFDEMAFEARKGQLFIPPSKYYKL